MPSSLPVILEGKPARILLSDGPLEEALITMLSSPKPAVEEGRFITLMPDRGVIILARGSSSDTYSVKEIKLPLREGQESPILTYRRDQT